MDGDLRQRTVVDLYYGSQKLSTFYATFTPNTLTFEDPKNVMAHIGEFENYEKVLETLSAPLPNNSRKVCRKNTKPPACGILTPEVVGIIFNESAFRVDIFFNPDYLKPIDGRKFKYLRNPKDEFNAISSINTAFNKSGSEDRTATVGINQVLSKKNLRGVVNYRFSDELENKYQFDEIKAEYDTKQFIYSAGVFNSKAFQLIPNADIVGISLETNLERRVDLEHSSTTPIIIFLNSLAQITLFRGDQVLNSFLLPAGNHSINTSNFPEGAYEIRIVINEFGGLKREERRFIVKSFLLSPNDTHNLFLEAGVIQDGEDELGGLSTTGKPSFTIGDRFRFSNNFGYNIALALRNNKTFFAPGLVSVLKGQTFLFDTLFNNKGDWGIGGFYQLNYEGIFGNLSLNRFNVQDDGGVTQNALDFELNSFEQYSGNIGYQWSRLSILLKGNIRRNKGEEKSYTYGPAFQIPFTLKDGSSLRLVSELIFDNLNELTASISLDLNYFRDRGFDWQGRGSLVNRKNTTISNQEDTTYDIETDLNYKTGGPGNRFINTLGLNNVNDLKSYEIESEYRGRFGQHNVFYNYIDQKENSENLGGNASFSVTYDSNDFNFGGEGLYESAIVINVSNSKRPMEFWVFINGINRGKVKSGEEFLIPLSPYQEYKVWLKNSNKLLNDFNGEEKLITLYPGNVTEVKYKIRPIYVLITKLIDENGSPIQNKQVEGGKEYSETDSNGFLQIEVFEDTEYLDVLELNCKVKIPGNPEFVTIQTIDELKCLKTGP